MREWLAWRCHRIALWHYEQSRRWFGLAARLKG